MILAAIKTSRFPSRVYLKFSTGLFFPFFIDDIVKLSLITGEAIDDAKFNKIITASLSYLAWEYGLKQIALSPKTEKVLHQKISGYLKRVIFKYKYPENSADLKEISFNCIQKIKSQGLLNDNEYIAYFIKKHYKKSKREIIYLLQQEGINVDSLSPSLFGEESDLDKIKKLLAKKVSDPKNLANFEYKNKITAFLYRKGFSLSNIKTAIDELLYSR